MYKVFRNVLSKDEIVEIESQFRLRCKPEHQDDEVFNRDKLSLRALKGSSNQVLKDIMFDANKTFQLTLFEDDPFEKWNLSTYYSDGFCTSHNDIIEGENWQRKLTVIVELSRECNGGELAISNQDFITNKLSLGLQPGDAVVFPSYVNHSVSPVIDGKRQSLTGWMKGPPLV